MWSLVPQLYYACRVLPLAVPPLWLWPAHPCLKQTIFPKPVFPQWQAAHLRRFSCILQRSSRFCRKVLLSLTKSGCPHAILGAVGGYLFCVSVTDLGEGPLSPAALPGMTRPVLTAGHGSCPPVTGPGPKATCWAQSHVPSSPSPLTGAFPFLLWKKQEGHQHVNAVSLCLLLWPSWQREVLQFGDGSSRPHRA